MTGRVDQETIFAEGYRTSLCAIVKFLQHAGMGDSRPSTVLDIWDSLVTMLGRRYGCGISGLFLSRKQNERYG